MNSLITHPKEAYWRGLYLFFQSRGYKLRPALHPVGLPASVSCDTFELEYGIWQDVVSVDVGPKVSCCLHAAFFQLPEDTICATDSIGRHVLIRSIATNSLELELLLEFSSLRTRSVSNNHSVPVVDQFQDPTDRDLTLIVTSYLIAPDRFPFRTVTELLDCFEQLLEVHIHSLYLSMSLLTATCIPRPSYSFIPGECITCSYPQCCLSQLANPTFVST